MRQIYRRELKFTSVWVFSCFLGFCIFSEHLFLKMPLKVWFCLHYYSRSISSLCHSDFAYLVFGTYVLVPHFLGCILLFESVRDTSSLHIVLDLTDVLKAQSCRLVFSALVKANSVRNLQRSELSPWFIMIFRVR